jgi:maltose-binding protein MalE
MTTNQDARTLTRNRQEFKTSNGTIYGTHNLLADTYTVYSYGPHFPMYVYDYRMNEWYGNSDKYSRTTTRHQSVTRPPNVSHWVDTETLKSLAEVGVVNYLTHKLAA